MGCQLRDSLFCKVLVRRIITHNYAGGVLWKTTQQQSKIEQLLEGKAIEGGPPLKKVSSLRWPGKFEFVVM